MALPTTVSTNAGEKGYQPPIQSSGGDFYIVAMRETTTDVEVFKATDPTDSWSNQDAGNRPIHGEDVTGFTYDVYDNQIFIIAWGDDGRFEHYSFDMDDDTWGTDELMRNATGDPPAHPWASIAIRSDGDLIVAYQGEFDEDMMDDWQRTDYARKEVSWTTGQGINQGGDNHYGNPLVVKSSDSDQMHFLLQATNDDDHPVADYETMHVRSLDSSNVLDGANTSANDTAAVLLGMGNNAVAYDDGGTQRVVWCGYDGTNILAWMSTLDGNDDIQSPTEYTALSDDVYVNGEVAVMSLAEENGNLHLIWSDSSTQDIFYSTSTDNGQNWSTATEILDGVTCNYISATIYDRGGDTVLAYHYDDAGDQKYNEYVLIAGSSGSGAIKLAGHGGLAGKGGLAGRHGGLAG